MRQLMNKTELRAAKVLLQKNGIMDALKTFLDPHGVDLDKVLDVGVRFVTPKIAALFCCMGERHIRKLATSGVIKSHKLGEDKKSRVLIELESLYEYITKQKGA